jgi:hypothetical protein
MNVKRGTTKNTIQTSVQKSAFGLVSFILSTLPMNGCRRAVPVIYEPRGATTALKVDEVGVIRQIGFPGPAEVRQVRAFTQLCDCEPTGSVKVARSDSQLSFQRRWISQATGNSALVTDRFSLGDADLRKAVDIVRGDYVIIGGMDQVNVLQKGTVEQAAGDRRNHGSGKEERPLHHSKRRFP